MRFKLLHFILIVSFFTFNQKVSAQISVGLKGHISMIGAPLVAKEDFLYKKLRPSFNPGVSVFGEYKINETMAIQAEVAFRQNRSHYQLRFGPPTVHSSIIDYVRLPLLFKLSQHEKWINLIFFGGPNPAYATGIRTAETVGNILVNDATFTSLGFDEYGIKRFDLAITVGLGIEKTIANKFRTSLDIRFDYGLIDIMEDQNDIYLNRGFAIEMGILIPVSKNKNY